MGDLKLTIDTDKAYLEELTVSFDSPIVFTGDNVTVNWGDSTTPTIYTSGTLSHTYDTGGEYEITITGNVTGINDYAFQMISEIVIPSSITNIGSYVFGNEIIEVVTFEGTTPPTLGSGSLNVDAEYGFTIRVPTGSLTTYQQSEHFPNVEWGNYELYTIEEYTPQSSSQGEQSQSGENNGTLASLYGHLKILHKQWFYEKLEMNSGYVQFSNTTGLVKHDGSIDTSTYLTSADISGKANTTDLAEVAFSGDYDDLNDVPLTFTPTIHSHNIDEVSDNSAYTNLEIPADSTQDDINSAVDSKVSALLGVDLVEVTNDKGTASANTMDKLYFEPEATSGTTNNYKIFVTVRTGTSGNYSYAWERVDSARISIGSLALDTHVHGNITRDGKVGNDSGYFVYTTTGGTATSKATIGNIDTNGAIGSVAGKVAVTSTDGLVAASDWVVELDDLVVDLINEGLSQTQQNNGGE